MVALMISVVRREVLVVQLNPEFETFQASGGLYRITGSLLEIGVADGMRPVVEEGIAGAVVPKALIQCIVFLSPSVKHAVPIASRYLAGKYPCSVKLLILYVRQQNPGVPITVSQGTWLVVSCTIPSKNWGNILT